MCPTQQGELEVADGLAESPLSFNARFANDIIQNILSKFQEKFPTGPPKHTSLCSVLGQMVPDFASHADKLKVDLIRRTVVVMDAARERERERYI